MFLEFWWDLKPGIGTVTARGYSGRAGMTFWMTLTLGKPVSLLEAISIICRQVPEWWYREGVRR